MIFDTASNIGQVSWFDAHGDVGIGDEAASIPP